MSSGFLLDLMENDLSLPVYTGMLILVVLLNLLALLLRQKLSEEDKVWKFSVTQVLREAFSFLFVLRTALLGRKDSVLNDLFVKSSVVKVLFFLAFVFRKRL
jgi:uncharacterized membrane protein